LNLSSSIWGNRVFEIINGYAEAGTGTEKIDSMKDSTHGKAPFSIRALS